MEILLKAGKAAGGLCHPCSCTSLDTKVRTSQGAGLFAGRLMLFWCVSAIDSSKSPVNSAEAPSILDGSLQAETSTLSSWPRLCRDPNLRPSVTTVILRIEGDISQHVQI